MGYVVPSKVREEAVLSCVKFSFFVCVKLVTVIRFVELSPLKLVGIPKVSFW